LRIRGARVVFALFADTCRVTVFGAQVAGRCLAWSSRPAGSGRGGGFGVDLGLPHGHLVPVEPSVRGDASSPTRIRVGVAGSDAAATMLAATIAGSAPPLMPAAIALSTRRTIGA
jgi:hypothetical protein